MSSSSCSKNQSQIGRKNSRCKTGLVWGSAIALSFTVLLTVAALIPRRTVAGDEACAVTLYVSGDWFHTNLTLPVQTPSFDWRDVLSLKGIGKGIQKDYAYLSFGWGDRQFYLNTPSLQDLKSGPTVHAFFWPSKTVMHVQGHHTLPQAAGSYRVEPVRVSKAGYRRLTAHILNTFEREEGQLQPIGQSHRDSGTFYEGRGLYGIWKTCNDWLALGLRAADVRTPVWSGTAASVFRQLQSGCVD